MNPEQLSTKLVVKLREKMRSVEPEEFDQMLDAQKALKQWAKEGGSEPMPFAEALRGWGIKLPSADAPSGPTPEETKGILQRLRELIMQDHSDWDAIQGVYLEVRNWQDGGMNGPLPQAAQLAKWGVWPEVADDPTTSLPNRVTIEPQDATEPLSSPDEEKTAAQSEFEDDPFGAKSESATVMGQGTGVDPDDKYQTRYEEGLATLDDENYYQARKIFDELRIQVHGRLAQPVDSAYFKASRQLQEKTQRLVQIAQERAEEDPNNLSAQAKAWEEVLKVNPESSEANKALARLAQVEADQNLGRQLPDILARAERAAIADQLPDLNELLGQVGSWKALGEKSPPEISGKLYQRLLELEEQITGLRAQTRERLGESSTLLASGDYREAYRKGRDYFERAVPKIPDAAGIFGPADEEIDTALFFKRARESFVPALRSLVAQRLDQAEGQEKENPEKARETLKDAYALLTDDVLTADDKEELKSDLEQVERKQSEVLRLIEKYALAKAKVIEAQSAATRHEALALFLEAKEEYANYPNLEIYIERARDEVAQVVAADVEGAIAAARRQMRRDEYQEALETLANARAEAIEQVPNPKPDTELRTRLEEIRTLEQEIARSEQLYQQMTVLLADIDEAFKRFDEGDLRAIRSARNLFEQFNDEERRHAAVRKRLADLADRQDDMDNWKSGQAEYNRQNWPTAEEILRKVASHDTANQQEAARLADRALACRSAEEASQAENIPDWKTARSKYELAISLLENVGTDALTAPVLQQCRQAINRLAPLVENDREVEQTLHQARIGYQAAQQRVATRTTLWQQVQPIAEFASVVALLKQAEQKQSTLTANVHALLQQVEQMWRQTYLQAMQAALEASEVEMAEKGMALAKELRSVKLLIEREDKRLASELEAKALDNQYERLLRKAPVPWEEVEENRQKRLAMFQTHNDEREQIEAEYRNAVRQRIFAQVREVKREKNATAAKNFLAQQLQGSTLRADEQLIGFLIELCWELEDWSEAERLAADIGHYKRALGDVWRGLTRAARWFKGGMVLQGRTEVRVVRERYKDDGKIKDLISKKEQAFRHNARDQLLQAAGDAMMQSTADGYIKAVEKYAEARELDSEDPRIFIGLQELGQRLEPGIRQRNTQAKALTIGQRSLTNAVQEIEALHSTLSAIEKVIDLLDLNSEVASDLEEALEVITPKRRRWKAMQDAFRKSDHALEQALQHPEPPSGDAHSSGGWDFSPVRRHLLEVQGIARRDTEGSELLKRRQDTLTKLQEQASELITHVNAFMKALHDEQFDNILTEIEELTVLWRRACQQAQWGGLNKLTRYRYRWYPREESELEIHKQLTIQRQSNLNEWERWSEETQESYQKSRSMGRKLVKSKSSTLEELRYEYSSAEIIALCRRCTQACDEFEDQLHETPETKPLSEAAETARGKVKEEAWKNEVLGKDGYRTRAEIIAKQAEDGLKQLTARNGPLTRLKRIINTQILPVKNNWFNKKVSHRSLSLAQQELERCNELDPQHKDVVKIDDLLKKLNEAGGDWARLPVEPNYV